MLGGLDRPTGGPVTVDGKNIFSLKDEALTIFRRQKIGFVFQNYNLVPVLNVRENIVLPIQLDGRKVDRGYVDQIVETLGLKSKLQSLPNNLSGGQQHGWPLPGPWWQSPPSFWPTSPPATWTAAPARM